MKAYIFAQGEDILCYDDGVYFYLNMHDKGPERTINVVCKTDKNEAEKYASKIGATIMECEIDALFEEVNYDCDFNEAINNIIKNKLNEI